MNFAVVPTLGPRGAAASLLWHKADHRGQDERRNDGGHEPGVSSAVITTHHQAKAGQTGERGIKKSAWGRTTVQDTVGIQKNSSRRSAASEPLSYEGGGNSNWGQPGNATTHVVLVEVGDVTDEESLLDDDRDWDKAIRVGEELRSDQYVH